MTNNGMYQFAWSMACTTGQEFSMYQEVTQWPFGMDLNYFKATKPLALLRNWFYSWTYYGTDTITHTTSLQFFNGGNEIIDKRINDVVTYAYPAFYDVALHEKTFLINDFHSFDFDKIKYLYFKL